MRQMDGQTDGHLANSLHCAYASRGKNDIITVNLLIANITVTFSISALGAL